MNTRLPLTDAQVRGAIARRAAADLPPDLRRSVLTAVATASQRRRWAAVPTDAFWRHSNARAFLALAAIALLVAASLVIAGALFHDAPLPRPAGLPAIVIQQWNGLEAESSKVAHLAFAPGADAATPASVRLPANAVGLGWSPGGERLAYFAAEDRPGLVTSHHGLALTGFYIAGADGANPVAVSLPRSLGEYSVFTGLGGGARWAPEGGLFAIPWSTGSCTEGNCPPPSGIDVFDASGNFVKTIDTGHVDSPSEAIWSPDGLALGWYIGSCKGSYCSPDEFQWQRVDGDAPVTTLPLDNGGVVWSTDGLLHVVSVRLDRIGDGSFNATVGRIFTMRPDGTGLREIPWTTDHPELIPSWSPDGRLLATLDNQVGSLRIHDVQTGRDSVVSVPSGLQIQAWAPDAGRIALLGGGHDSAVFAFYVINADGTGLVALGEGEDFAWAPAFVVAAP